MKSWTKGTPNRKSTLALVRAVLAIFAITTIGGLRAGAADSVADQISSAANKAEEAVKDAGQTAQEKAEQLWRRIDEKRLKNRTPDQVVAWVIIGLLVAGLIQRFSKLNWFATLLLGLAGSFVGGIAQNLIHLDLGWGPVLISYEELLASVIGGLLVIILARLLASRKAPKQ